MAMRPNPACLETNPHPPALWPFSPSAPFQCPCSPAIACLGPQHHGKVCCQPVGPPCWQAKQQIKHRLCATNWSQPTILPMLGARLFKDSSPSKLITATENQQRDPCLRILLVCRQRPGIKGHRGRISCLAEANPSCLAPQCMSSTFQGRWGLHVGNPFSTYTGWPWLSHNPYTCETQ